MHSADEDSYHSITIGYIPIDNDSEIIAVGDPSGSNTVELWLQIYGGVAVIGKKEFKLGKFNIYDETSKFWSDIASLASKELTEGKVSLDPKHLAYCFLRPQGETFGNDDIWHVASPDDCGEFHNEDSDHNGKYFVKYEFCSDDEYLDENVYVIQ